MGEKQVSPNCQDAENKRLNKQKKGQNFPSNNYYHYIWQMNTVFTVLTYCQFENIKNFYSKEVRSQRWSLRRRYSAFPLEPFSEKSPMK